MADPAPSTDVAPANDNALIPPAADGAVGGTVNAPALNPRTLKPKRRAISDVTHLFQIIRTLEEARRIQNEKNGRIMAKYNAERPYPREELAQNGMDWRSNFTTKPLSSAIDKVSPRLTKAVQSARFLTSSAFPENHPGGKEKTERFRRKITEVIRGWDGWVDFLNEVAQEDAIFGFTSTAWLDEYSWRPTHFRQDEFFVPDGTRQYASGCQLWAGKQFVMIHELARYIENPEAARNAGWDIDNVVAALNEAKPRSIAAAGQSNPYTDFRTWEDAIRESSVSLSLLAGSKTIELYHVFVPEYDGQISHYIVDGRAKKILFEKLDQFSAEEGMQYVLTLFSFQQANGKLMGSKGIGRELYEIAAAVDRVRNEAVDRLQLSGKILIQGDAKQLNRFAISVLGNAVLVPANYTISQQKNLDPNVEAFIALDRQLVGYMDQIAGGVTPKEFGNERTTAAEVNLFAAREEEKRDTLIERFLMQVGKMVETCQRRICNPKVDDADAVEARKDLLRYMTEEELKLVANRPALRTVEDLTDLKAQQLVIFAQEKRNDPMFDQQKLQKAAAAARIDADFAEDVVLPTPDPTVEAEQSREQMQENVLIAAGQKVPVSPRDNHEIHIGVLKPVIATASQGLAQADEKQLAIFQNALQHWQDHINTAVAGGADKALFAEDMRQLSQAAKELGQLQAIAAQRAQMNAAPAPGGAVPAPAAPAPEAPAEAAPAEAAPAA